MSDHPVAAAVRAAAAGRFPPVDGRWERVDPWTAGVEAVVAFTGHAYIVTAGDHGLDLDALGADGYGGAHHPRLVTALAGDGGWIDSIDAALVAPGRGQPGVTSPLVERPDLADHHRVRYATNVRQDVRVFGHPTGESLVTIGRGVGGLTELGVETTGAAGTGVALLTDALALVAADDIVVAGVAPGNARALRSFLTAGFRPIASVQLLRPAR